MKLLMHATLLQNSLGQHVVLHNVLQVPSEWLSSHFLHEDRFPTSSALNGAWYAGMQVTTDSRTCMRGEVLLRGRSRTTQRQCYE